MAKSETAVQKPRRLCDFLRESKRWILAEWGREVGRHASSPGLYEPWLLGHLPDLLEWVAQRLETVHTGGQPALKELPETPALERLKSGEDLEQVMHEYALLRACILRLYESQATKLGGGELAVTLREVRRFDETLDEAVSTTVSRYTLTRERTLEVRESAETTLGPEDLEILLPELRACLPEQEHAQRRLLDVILAIKRNAAEALQHRNARYIQSFLGFISHELHSPLNVITLQAGAMERLECGDDRHKQFARRIITASRRMTGLIDVLNHLLRERFHHGIVIFPEAANLQDLWRDVLKELEDLSPEPRLRLSTQGDLQGEWDPKRVVQLLGILGKLALRHSPKESLVDLAFRDEGDTVCMELHHEGPPIPADDLPHFFTSWGMAPDLGRLLLPGIVRAHGGTLTVRSSETEGTTFTVKLPRYSSKKKAGDEAAVR